MKYITPNILNFGSPSNERSSVGHASYNWLAGLIVSKLVGCEFIHSPFTNDCERFENFLNFGDGFKTIKDLQDYKLIEFPQLNFSHTPEIDDSIAYNSLNKIKQQIETSPENTIFTFKKSLQFPGALIKDSEFVCNILSKSYWKHNSKHKFQDLSKPNVCIHIRRGDINQHHNSDRWENNEHYLNIIKNIKDKINANFYIISEGQENDFPKLKEYCTLVLNGSDIKSFNMMASADILVTGQSTFSTIISYINRGIIIYTPCLNFTRYETFDKKRFIHYKNIKTQLCVEK